MATITIRGLDEGIKARLRIRAAEHGRSMEAEVREILRLALPTPNRTGGLASRINARFSQLGGWEIELPTRADQPRAVDFSG